MDTPILSDIKVLDNLLALNLNVSLWSARKKMVLEDFGGAELPPEDLASLGSKRIADPNNLKVFVTLKARAFNYLDRHGIRFMSGWAIPEDKAGEIIRELIGIRDEFLKEKDAFLADYDQSIENWTSIRSGPALSGNPRWVPSMSVPAWDSPGSCTGLRRSWIMPSRKPLWSPVSTRKWKISPKRFSERLPVLRTRHGIASTRAKRK